MGFSFGQRYRSRRSQEAHRRRDVRDVRDTSPGEPPVKEAVITKYETETNVRIAKRPGTIRTTGGRPVVGATNVPRELSRRSARRAVRLVRSAGPGAFRCAARVYLPPDSSSRGSDRDKSTGVLLFCARNDDSPAIIILARGVIIYNRGVPGSRVTYVRFFFFLSIFLSFCPPPPLP